MKVRIISSLGFKIGFAIVVIEAGALALLGHFYLKRFSAQVDDALQNALAKPGQLLSQGLLNLNMVSDRAALEKLMGRGLVELMVISADGRIFNATRPGLVGEHMDQIPGFDPSWLREARKGSFMVPQDEGGEHYLNHVSPIDVGPDRTAFLFVYAKMRTTDAEHEKAELRRFFIAGALATLASTTAALLIFFHFALTRRLARVAETVDHVAAGDLSARTRGNGVHDEVGQMRDGVNRMAERLQQTIQSLESTVRELHEVRQQLETQSTFREAIITRATEGICVFQQQPAPPHIRFSVWNDAMVRITGHTLEQINRTGIQPLFHHAPGTAGITDRLEQLWNGNHITSEEWTLSDAAGTRRTILLSTAPLPGTSPARQILALVQDITARKRDESERIRLEREVAHAQKLKSLGILAGGIAHDFNNILTAILGHTELALLDAPEGSPIRDDLAEVQRSTHRAADLARQMLSYSGKGRFHFAPINLNTLIHENTRLLTAAISSKVPLQLHLAENLPDFPGDPTQITQILMNLVTNAAESMEQTPAPITITTTHRTCDIPFLTTGNLARETTDEAPLLPGPHVILQVTDTGCGMTDATIEKIFDPFFTTKFTGRGLGLAVVLGIIRGHHAALYVHSRPGHGTTFTVCFPITPAPHPAPARRTPPPPAAAPINPGGLILYADDEAPIRALATEMLHQLGHTVITAADGHEAVHLLQTRAPEIRCIILDLTMPRLDGVAAFEQIHTLAPNIPVIICSGYSEQNITERFTGKPIAGFLQKPYTLQKLADLLRATLAPPPIAADI